jgi:hypothetical protein
MGHFPVFLPHVPGGCEKNLSYMSVMSGIFICACRILSAQDQYLSITGTGVPCPPALLSGLNTKIWLTVLPPVHLIPQKWLTTPPVSCSSHYESIADSAFISPTQFTNLADTAATCHSLLQTLSGKAAIFSHTS